MRSKEEIAAYVARTTKKNEDGEVYFDTSGPTLEREIIKAHVDAETRPLRNLSPGQFGK